MNYDELPPKLPELVYVFHQVDPDAYAGLDADMLAAMETKYSAADILAFDEATAWAIAHPDFPFADIVPPFKERYAKFTHAALLKYLTLVHTTMKPLVDKLRAK